MVSKTLCILSREDLIVSMPVTTPDWRRGYQPKVEVQAPDPWEGASPTERRRAARRSQPVPAAPAPTGMADIRGSATPGSAEPAAAASSGSGFADIRGSVAPGSSVAAPDNSAAAKAFADAAIHQKKMEKKSQDVVDPAPQSDDLVQPQTSVQTKPSAEVRDQPNSYAGPSQAQPDSSAVASQNGAGSLASIYAQEKADGIANMDAIQSYYNGQGRDDLAQWAAANPMLAQRQYAKEQAKLDSKVSGIGPVADGEAYANNVLDSRVSGVGPVVDGQSYAESLGVTGVGPVINGDAYANLLTPEEDRVSLTGVKQSGKNLGSLSSVNAPRISQDPNIMNNAADMYNRPPVDFTSGYSSQTQPGQIPSVPEPITDLNYNEVSEWRKSFGPRR